ncbi:MAG: hypothetical protein IV085_06595 [Thiobacillus sp.]|nr:hypothetical protein [Thiobacillus sp.]
MQLMTRKNGGDMSLQEVARAWKSDDHHFHWSEYESDRWAVEFAQKLHQEETEALQKEEQSDRSVH